MRPGLEILYAGTLPPHPGGSAILANLLLPRWVAAGHSVTAVAPDVVSPQDPVDRFAERNPAISVTRYEVPYFENAIDAPVREDYRSIEARQLREILPERVARRRPCVIIAGRESFAWHVPEFARGQAIPSVLLVHGGRTFSQATNSSPDIAGRHLLKRFHLANRVVVVAEHQAETMRRLGFDDVGVVPNPVDLERFCAGAKSSRLLVDLGLTADDFVVSHISKLSSIKRPMDLVTAAQRTLPICPKLRFVIVGNGPLRNEMIKACRSSGILERFRFTGWVEHEDIPDYVNLADLVVMPSESEGQPLVYLETQACERLILASDIPAAREMIEDDRTGLLFRKGDVEDLAAKILMASADPTLREAIGRQARRAAERHSVDDCAAAHLAELETVVRGAQRIHRLAIQKAPWSSRQYSVTEKGCRMTDQE